MRSLAGGRTRRLGSARRAVAAPVQQRLAARAGCTLPAAALPASSRLNASTEVVPTVGDLAGEAGDANAKDALLADLQAADGPNLGHVGTSAEQVSRLPGVTPCGWPHIARGELVSRADAILQIGCN